MQKYLVAGAIFAALCAAPAAGQQAGDVALERISIADLDLDSEAGQRALKRRIGQATESVCGSYAGKRDDYEIDAIDECRRRVRAEVDRTVEAKVNQQKTRLARRW